MDKILHITYKELRQYLYSPVPYIVAAVFHGIMGFFFYSSMVKYSGTVMEMASSGPAQQAHMTPTLVIIQGLMNSMGTLFVLLTPLLTMRLLAEEKRGRTMELLMTSPLTTGAILMGKFLAAYIIYLAVILISLYIPLTVDLFSTVNWAHVALGYLGLALLGAAMISAGILASAVTDKQVVAAVLSIGILVIFWFVGGGIGGANRQVTEVLREVSLYQPFSNMLSGLLDLRDVAFLLSYAGAMLFMSHRVMEAGRW